MTAKYSNCSVSAKFFPMLVETPYFGGVIYPKTYLNYELRSKFFFLSDLAYTDIEEAGWNVNLIPFEVGSRGQITTRNKKSIIESCKRNSLKMKHTQIMKEMSKISLLCSFAIFQARGQPSWQDPPLLPERIRPWQHRHTRNLSIHRQDLPRDCHPVQMWMAR